MKHETNPTIKAPYRLGMTKDEMQFLIHVLDQHRIAQLDNLMEIDEASDYDKPIMIEIQMCDDMINKILRKITECDEMKARREYYDE